MAGCCFAECQAPAQAFLRPGMWIPGLRRLHLFEQEWQISASVDEVGIYIVHVEKVELWSMCLVTLSNQLELLVCV